MLKKEQVDETIIVSHRDNEELKDEVKFLKIKICELENQIELQNRVKELENEKTKKLKLLENKYKDLQLHWLRIYDLTNKEGKIRYGGSLTEFKRDLNFTQGRMWGLSDGIQILKNQIQND